MNRDGRDKPGHDRGRHPTSISPTRFLAGLSVIRTSRPSAVKNSISRRAEKPPARAQAGAFPRPHGSYNLWL
jgi:hypothetical protein